MGNSLTETKAEVFFLIASNKILYKKEFTLDTEISEVIEKYSRITNSDFLLHDIQIKFTDIKLLDRIYIRQQDENTFWINYHFPDPEFNYSPLNPFDEIIIGNLSKEETEDRIIRQFYKEIWKRDKQIMNVFCSDELFLEWGGTRNGYSSDGISELVVNYYFDGIFWLLFLKSYNDTKRFKSITFESIHRNANDLSIITQEIIDSIKTKLLK